ncbi:hypothetical protein [Paraflavitalea pollutisoli]|uniref:hypothetical protein n=1 Tax=Paraflavitalea pollutisoli TaxID=3034143 RepID=UPI0023EDADC0|nr:hypothetical protein [Paraflavitalea sp. H1-2-19X]
MEENKLSGEDSLQLIQQMIQSSRDEHQENGDGWLLWGWLLFSASVISCIMGYMGYGRYVGEVWLGMLVVGLIAYAFNWRSKKARTNRVQTYMQGLLNKIQSAFFISLLAILAGSYLGNHSFSFGYFYILYAFWMFIHGSAIRFKPLIVGAWVNWAAALGIFLATDFRHDMMISALAVLIGYLIPGYMLRSEFRKKMQSTDRIAA